MVSSSRSTARSRFRYDNKWGVRERVLTVTSRLLSQSTKPLWYLETIVLSSRFLQKLSAEPFAVGKRQKSSNRYQLWADHVQPYLQRSGKPIVALEFGVASGLATRTWLSLLDQFEEWHGFDTFEGLPEPWKRGGVEVMKSGVFAPEDQTHPFPRIDSYLDPTWHRGLIADSLKTFKRPSDNPLFVLIDVDLYAPTVDILSWLEINGRKGDCVYFDEAFDPFNEGAALDEAVVRGLKFRVLAHTGSALAIVLD